MKPLNLNALHLLALFVLAAVIQGCAPPIYGLGVFNSTSDTIEGVAIEYQLGAGSHIERYGNLGSHTYTAVDGNPRPIPKYFVARWQTASASHTQQVVRPEIKDEEKFDGTVWFEMTDTGVKVIPLSREEEMKRWTYKSDFLH